MVVIVFLGLTFSSFGIARADVVANATPKYSMATMSIIFKILGISDSDARVVLSILYPTSNVADTTSITSTDIATNNSTVPAFSIETINKGNYVQFKEDNAQGVTMEGVVYKMPSGGYVNDSSGQLYECGDIVPAWTSSPYPYPCPTDSGNYETKSNLDNYGRSTPFDVDGVTMPAGTSIYYYKAVDSNGKVYEYTAN